MVINRETEVEVDHSVNARPAMSVYAHQPMAMQCKVNIVTEESVVM